MSITKSRALEANTLREFRLLVYAEEERMGVGPTDITSFRYPEHLLPLINRSDLEPAESSDLPLFAATAGGIGAARLLQPTAELKNTSGSPSANHDANEGGSNPATRRSILKGAAAVGAAALGLAAFGHTQNVSAYHCEHCRTTTYEDCNNDWWDYCISPWPTRLKVVTNYYYSNSASGSYCYNYCKSTKKTMCASWCPI